MVGSPVWNCTRAVGQLPRDEDAALAADLHPGNTLIEARDRSANSLHKLHGLRVAQLGLAVVTHHRLAVLVSEGRARMVVGGVEFDPVGGSPSGVEDLE